jgi:hypothetical protein
MIKRLLDTRKKNRGKLSRADGKELGNLLAEKRKLWRSLIGKARLY